MKKGVEPIQSLRSSYQSMIDHNYEVNPKILNLGLLSNPFLKDQDHFRGLHHELHLYNKRVSDQALSDHYQVKSYEKLFTITSDLVNLNSPQDMVTRLEEVWKWWGEQKRKIKQRKDLGMIKYKADRHTEKLRHFRERMSKSEVRAQSGNLPNQIRFAQIQPYENNNRTAHKEMKVPLKRLSEYKVKRLNLIDSHIKGIMEVKPQRDRVLYLKPPKYVPPEEEKPEENPENIPENKENVEGQPANPENPQNPPQTDANNPEQPAEEGDPNNKPPQGEDPNQQDLGGFGEEPGEPQQEAGDEDEGPGQDKLAPKNKIYTTSIRQREEEENQKKYSKPYMYYKGNDFPPERRMEERAILSQQYSLQIKREEEEMIQLAHKWATKKEKVDKQREYLLQNRLFRPKYSLSYEDPEKKEMLSVPDEKKYGFYVPTKIPPKNEIELDDKLPQLPQFKPYEKNIRKDRLNLLKNKFGSILSLRESSEEPTRNASTLCQTSPRRRDLSMILEDHSLEKQRLKELQEIQKIKQSLGKQRININIRTLSQALVPQALDDKREDFVSPSKDLPNNPFWVEAKKKKKKK